MVAYDDSDSDAEPEAVDSIHGADRVTGAATTAAAPGPARASGSLAMAAGMVLPADPASCRGAGEQRLPLARLGRGRQGSCPTQRLQWPRNEPKVTLPISHPSSSLWTSHAPASTLPLATAFLKPVKRSWDTSRSPLCAQSESEAADLLKTVSCSQRKKGEDIVIPYVPKRLRQLQVESVEAGRSEDTEPPRPPAGCAPAPCCVAPRVSEFIQPYLKGQHRETQVPSKVLFHLRGHRGPVNSIQWCPVLSASHLLLSTSMDKTFKEPSCLVDGVTLESPP